MEEEEPTSTTTTDAPVIDIYGDDVVDEEEELDCNEEDNEDIEDEVRIYNSSPCGGQSKKQDLECMQRKDGSNSNISDREKTMQKEKKKKTSRK